MMVSKKFSVEKATNFISYHNCLSLQTSSLNARNIWSKIESLC